MCQLPTPIENTMTDLKLEQWNSGQITENKIRFFIFFFFFATTRLFSTCSEFCPVLFIYLLFYAQWREPEAKHAMGIDLLVGERLRVIVLTSTHMYVTYLWNA